MWSESAWMLSATLLLCPRHGHHTRTTHTAAERAGTAVVLSLGLTGRNRGDPGLRMPAELYTHPVLLWKRLKNKVRKTYFQIQEEVHLGKRQPFWSQFEHNTNAGGAKTLNRAAHQTSRGKKKKGGKKKSEFAHTDMQTPSQSTAWSARSERRI